MNKPYQYIARFVVEAKTPLHIGTHQTDFSKTQAVARDFNQLPYLPGTALAGWLSDRFEHNQELFGGLKKEKSASDEPEEVAYGSSVILSDGYLLDEKSSVHQTLIYGEKSHFLNRFDRLPVRDHVRIGHNGAGEDGGKFEEEVVFKGARFKFELQWSSNEEKVEQWIKLVDTFSANEIRIGGGESNGFGLLEVIECKTKIFNLKDSKDYSDYEQFTVDLNNDCCLEAQKLTEKRESNYKLNYDLKLNGEDTFFLFSSGIPHPDFENMAQHYFEYIIEWDENGNGRFSDEPKIVIPGSSLKGILAHRVAWHYNLANEQTIDKLISGESSDPTDKLEFPDSNVIKELSEDELQEWESKLKAQLRSLNNSGDLPVDKYLGVNNPAVLALFGSASDEAGKSGQIGAVLIEDLWLENPNREIFHHNKIDRFTQGTVHGALYGEEAINVSEIILRINIRTSAMDHLKDENGKSYLEYLDLAINDIKTGQLALSGRSAKGHGRFKELKSA